MSERRGNSVQGKIPTLVIDSSAIRNHLFKGWAVLNRVAVVARAGKINLCIPWLVEQEVLSGIEKHVDELTGQETFLKSARMIAGMSTDAASIRELCDRFEKLRPNVCEEARSRFRHWLESSQAERLPLKPEHTANVFDAYFAGDTPFDRPKNREHLPDAFIYNCVLDLVSKGAEVWFLAGDGLLRDAFRQNKSVRVFRDFYPVFADLQVPFDYQQQQALGLVLPDTQALCESAREALISELRGQALRFGDGQNSVPPRIRDVLRVKNLSVDRQSLLHIDDASLLIAFEAEILTHATERSIESREVVDRLSEFTATIRGHFLVGIEKSPADGNRITTLEVDDIEVGGLERHNGSEIVQSVPPVPEVVFYYRNEFDKIVSQHGLVVVVGSTLRNRRIVAEHILAATAKSHDLTLQSYQPIRESIASIECGSDLGPLWDKAHSADVSAVGISCEDSDWAMEAVLFVARKKRFVVATMKSANNRSAVVRYLAGLPNRRNNLEALLAVAWIQEVTPETITFAISQHGGWGDGSWDAVLERDEWLKRSSNS